MRKIQMIIIKTLKILHIEWARDDMMIFISIFLEIILKGLSVRNSFRTAKSSVDDISIIAVMMIIKSRIDQLSLRYAF